MSELWEVDTPLEITFDQEAFLREIEASLEAAEYQKTYDKFALFTAYPKQQLFFSCGVGFGQRMFNAGNRLGKTEAGAFEMACHLTGDYPTWWTGRRFAKAVSAWAVGLSAEATRDIVQEKLCGQPLVANAFGTGMVPKDKFAAPPSLSRGKAGAYDTIQVKHKSGGVSVLMFKSCEQGWEKFQGTAKDVIWMDEEPDDYKVYTECVTRTLDTGGLVYVTYTPLSGENSDLWQAFKNPKDKAKKVISMSAREVLDYPNSHITLAKFEEMLESWPAHERETRASGAPSVGAGAVFTFPRAQIECPAIHDPGGHVTGGWGLDFGGQGGTTLKYSHPFGAVFGIHDRSSDVIYIMRALRLPGGQVLAHASAMKAIAENAVVFWPHDGHRHTDDTTTTQGQYRAEGLTMYPTHATFKTGGYSTEAGVLEMQRRFETGRLKICANLSEWWEEYGSYSRDEKGEIVKVKDDLMSATRILVMMLPRFGRPFTMGSKSASFNWSGGISRTASRAIGASESHWGFDD